MNHVESYSNLEIVLNQSCFTLKKTSKNLQIDEPRGGIGAPRGMLSSNKSDLTAFLLSNPLLLLHYFTFQDSF